MQRRAVDGKLVLNKVGEAAEFIRVTRLKVLYDGPDILLMGLT